MVQTAAEYEKRKENFFNELEVVFADVVCYSAIMLQLITFTVALPLAIPVNGLILCIMLIPIVSYFFSFSCDYLIVYLGNRTFNWDALTFSVCVYGWNCRIFLI